MTQIEQPVRLEEYIPPLPQVFSGAPQAGWAGRRTRALFQLLPPIIHGLVSVLFLFINTLACCIPLFLITFLKMIAPVPSWRRFLGRILNEIATYWVWVNNLIIHMTKHIEWDVRGVSELDRKGWYLVISNHRSWLDIVVLQKVLYRRIPFLKFFLKKQLIWVPLLGQAWWALDFPFMKRHSKEYLKRHPEKQGQDLETTRKACRKFKEIPISIMNFVEGTRFAPDKARRQESPYSMLLKPKAAGVAFVLGAMGEQLSGILNVTIYYPQRNVGFWKFMCGKVQRIRVLVETIPVHSHLLGDYFTDQAFQQRFQVWLNNLWADKEKLLCSMANTDKSLAGGASW